MIETIIGLVLMGSSYSIVKKFRPRAFTSCDPLQLVTDIALTVAGTFTVAPLALSIEGLKLLLGFGTACISARR